MPESIYFYNLATGQRTQLSRTPTRRAMRDITGRMMPPVSRSDAGSPGIMGSSPISLRYETRDITIPMLIYKSRRQSAYDEFRLLCEELNFIDPVTNDFATGYLEVARDGLYDSRRRLACHYSGGYEGQEGLPHAMKAVLTFRSVGEPFWEDVDPITTTYSLVVGQGTFLPFPSASGNFINITQSSIFNSTVLTNNGKLYCWPQWTLTGPGSNIVLFNKTTDRRLQIDATLAAGEVITVETDPASRGVFAANGDSLMNLVNLNMGQPDFWPLIPGAQTLQLEVNGADANARIAVSYRNRYMPA